MKVFLGVGAVLVGAVFVVNCSSSGSNGGVGGSGGGSGTAGGAGTAGVEQRCVDHDEDGVPSFCDVEPPAVLDCDDFDATRFPGATETCDQRDNDCNGEVDDGSGAPACSASCVEPSAGCDPPVAIATTQRTVCYLTKAGDVYCTGSNLRGELGNYQQSWARSPLPVPGVHGASHLVSDGYGAFCAIMPSGAACWGDGVAVPRRQPLPSGEAQSYYFSGQQLCALSKVNALTCISLVDGGEATLATTGVVAVAAFGSLVCAANTGDIRCWGYSNSGFEVDGTPFGKGATVLALGLKRLCAVTQGELRCWSQELEGYEGDGTVVPGNGSATSISLSEDSECALGAAGKVACWLGNAPTDLAEATQVGVGKGFGCALTTESAIRCWGSVDRGGAPVLEKPSTPQTRTLTYAVPSALPEVPLLLGPGATGACANRPDLASISSVSGNGVLQAAQSCVSSCQGSLDPAQCVAPCYDENLSYAPLSSPCMSCVTAYFGCQGAPCIEALHDCAGAPLLFMKRNKLEPDDTPSEGCPACADKKLAGEVCTTDSDCRSDYCDTLIAAPGAQLRVCSAL